MCQRWIVKGEQSGLPMPTAATESVSLCERMKSSLPFWNLEAAIFGGNSGSADWREKYQPKSVCQAREPT